MSVFVSIKKDLIGINQQAFFIIFLIILCINLTSFSLRFGWQRKARDVSPRIFALVNLLLGARLESIKAFSLQEADDKIDALTARIEALES